MSHHIFHLHFSLSCYSQQQNAKQDSQFLFLKRETSPNYSISNKMGSIIDEMFDIVLPKDLKIHPLGMTMDKKMSEVSLKCLMYTLVMEKNVFYRTGLQKLNAHILCSPLLQSIFYIWTHYHIYIVDIIRQRNTWRQISESNKIVCVTEKWNTFILYVTL